MIPGGGRSMPPVILGGVGTKGRKNLQGFSIALPGLDLRPGIFAVLCSAPRGVGAWPLSELIKAAAPLGNPCSVVKIENPQGIAQR
jgi:hypothetical protein